MKIRRLGPGDEPLVLAAAALFDSAPTEAWTKKFLAEEGHHLFVAVDDDLQPVGFVTGVGRALVAALAKLARERGCYGMWVLTDADNAPALAAYRAAGAGAPEPNVMLSWTFEP